MNVFVRIHLQINLYELKNKIIDATYILTNVNVETFPSKRLIDTSD